MPIEEQANHGLRPPGWSRRPQRARLNGDTAGLRAVVAVLLSCSVSAQHAVVATTPDLASLCRSVGGEAVTVVSLARGPEDPHFVDARPSMLRALRAADALVEVGRELEIGWLSVLVDNARNGAILVGQNGRIDASAAVRVLGLPTGPVDRSHGDVHGRGNPHYLADPLCGLQVAALLRDRFAAAWPAERDQFAANFATFRRDLAIAMVGEALARKYDHDAERLALAFGAGRLEKVLREQGDLRELGGWFGAMAPLRGAPLVADHDVWPYFAERFGVRVVGFLEPKPGVAPTTAHLDEVAATMRAEKVRVILSSPFFAPQHAERLAKATGAAVVPMLHQCGAKTGVDDYIAFVDTNVRSLAAALAADGAPHK